MEQTSRVISGEYEYEYEYEFELLKLAIRSNNLSLVSRLVSLGVNVNDELWNTCRTLGAEGLPDCMIPVQYYYCSSLICLFDRIRDSEECVKTVEEIAKVLVNAGADVNAKDSLVTSVLQIAIAFGASPCTIKLLIEQGADIEYECTSEYSNGETPLIFAINRGDYRIVEMLLDFGADVNKVNMLGRSPLFYALRSDKLKSENLEIISLLFARGANPNLKNNDVLCTIGSVSTESLPSASLVQEDIVLQKFQNMEID